MTRTICPRYSCVLAIALAFPCAAVADGDDPPIPTKVQRTPISQIGRSVKASFWGWNTVLHVGGIAATPALVASGADTRVHNFWVDHEGFSPYTVPGVVGGYFAPFLLGVGLSGYSWLADSATTSLAAQAVVHSLVIAFTYQALLKAISGRASPESVRYSDDAASRRFQVGFLRNGIDWGWPSGLLMTNTAVLVSLAHVYPDSWLLRLGGAAYIGYLFVSAPAHEQAKLCWFSDAVAGLAMGVAIGRGVGNSLMDSRDGLLDRVNLLPMVALGGKGIAASFQF